jgi:type IV pilus assembly protein PilA
MGGLKMEILKTNQSLSKKNKKKGFTLMELIIVLAVMAIIAAIAIPSFNGVRENSKVSSDKQSCETIQRMVKVYVADGTLSDCTFTISANGENSLTADSIQYTTIKSALSGIKAPQSKAADNHYTVTISGGGDTITVVSKVTT